MNIIFPPKQLVQLLNSSLTWHVWRTKVKMDLKGDKSSSWNKTFQNVFSFNCVVTQDKDDSQKVFCL